jgi:activator of HSP90 ATPase
MSSTTLNLGAAPSPNWHWKNKNVKPWAENWFRSELAKVVSTDNGIEIEVEEVTLGEDDVVELGMRKSKLITIFDCRIEVKWTATESDKVAKGKLVIPEVSHQTTCDKTSDYGFDWSLKTKETLELYAHVKKTLPKILIAKFEEFPNAMVETHGKDLTVTQSGTATPEIKEGSTHTVPPNSISKAATIAAASRARLVNTGPPLNVEGSFMASAETLFNLLTKESEIPVWAGDGAKSNPTVSGEYSLFGGSVSGKYVSLERPKKIVQTWKFNDTVQNYEATLTITFDQGSDSTKVLFNLVGVPIGQEDVTTRNLQGKYIHRLNQIGYVKQSQPSPPPKPSNTMNLPLLITISAGAAALFSIYYFS